MKISREKAGTCYLKDTPVENIFINEYMPEAPEDFVKVYLLALMHGDMKQDIDLEEIGDTLSLDQETVRKAFTYWHKAGLVRMSGDVVEFISMKEQLYGNNHEKPAMTDSGRRLLNDKETQVMFDRIEKATKEYLSPTKMQTILSWLESYDTTPRLIATAFEYGAEEGKTHPNYIEAIVKEWSYQGVKREEDAKERLEATDRRHAAYRRVMKALGFKRFATEEEERQISAWMDELGCSMDDILAACAKTSGIPNPNINYVDSVLRNRKKESGGQVNHNSIKDYYENLRAKAEADAAARREEVYAKVPRIEEIEKDLLDVNIALTGALMGGEDAKAESLKQKAKTLEDEKLRLLTENDIPIDQMNVRYHCRICNDTGITREGSRCRCYREALEQA